MVKCTKITQHCEIPKQLHYIVIFTNNIKESRDATATVRTPVLVDMDLSILYFSKPLNFALFSEIMVEVLKLMKGL